MMPSKPKISFSDFIKNMNEQILLEQKHFWLNRKMEVILTTNPYDLYSGKKKLSEEIDWYSEDMPFYGHHSKWKRFCENHFYVGKV